MTNDVEHVFVCRLVIFILCFGDLSVQFLCLFLNWVICLSLLFSCKTIDRPLSVIGSAGIFSSSVDYLFNSFIMLFVTFHFDESSILLFFFLSFIGLGWKAVTGESALELGNLRSGPSFNAHCFFLSTHLTFGVLVVSSVTWVMTSSVHVIRKNRG